MKGRGCRDELAFGEEVGVGLGEDGAEVPNEGGAVLRVMHAGEPHPQRVREEAADAVRHVRGIQSLDIRPKFGVQRIDQALEAPVDDGVVEADGEGVGHSWGYSRAAPREESAPPTPPTNARTSSGAVTSASPPYANTCRTTHSGSAMRCWTRRLPSS